MANNQDIKLRRLEELLAEYQEALTKTTQRSEYVKINNAILLVQDAIEQEKTFRTDRDDVLRRRDEFERVKADVTRLISEVQTGPVQYDQAAFDELLRQYEKLTGSDDLPRDKDGHADYAAALAQIQHLDTKLQVELDAVYGNVDARMLNKDKKELESIEKGIAEKTQRGKNYRELKQTLAKLKADPNFATKFADYKKAEADLEKAKQELAAKQEKVDQIDKQIKANQAEIDKLQKELKDLQAMDPAKMTKEQKDRLAALPGEISALEGKNTKLNGDLTKANSELTKAQDAVNDRQADFAAIAVGMQDLVDSLRLIKELGLQDGDKPFELTDDIDAAMKFVGSAHRSEHLTAQKRELQERATMILDKYGVEADTRKGKFVESLDARVEDILKNYNPAHIQPGFDDRMSGRDEEEHDEPAPAAPGEDDGPAPAGSNSNPAGAPGTRSSSVGGGFGGGPTFGGGFGGGPTGGAPGGTGTPPAPTTPPTPEKDGAEEHAPDHEDGNDYHNALARGEIVEKFDGDLDFQALLAEPGRTKIEKGYVYRIADIGPDGSDPDKREYAQVREPIDWYMQDTTKKLGRALTGLIAQLRELDDAELDKLWKDLGITSLDTNRLRIAVTSGPLRRAKNHHELMGELEGIDPKAQVEMLVALTTLSEEDPKRAAECLMKMHGNPYPYKSDLIVTTEKAGLFGRKQKPKVVEMPSGAEDLLEGYKANQRGEGARRGPTERQPSKGPKKTQKRDDRGESR